MAEILRVEDLKKYFQTRKGTLHAVDGVTFSVQAGKTWASWASPAAASPPWGG